MNAHTPQTDRLAAALSDRYRIERELGAGGMAIVYLAQDLKHNRRVALKVLKPDLAVALGAERFLREITTTANLRHPHILPLFDSGEADSFLYYVMPFVEGETLRDRLSRDRHLPLHEAIELSAEIADALSYAHSRDVVHRDIKPENILLENGHAIVADFGIARAVSAAGAETLTQTGVAVGTPAYMSPEQAAAEPVDARGDLYALGCVTYEMLAGRPPFVGPAESVVRQHLAVAPAPVTALRSEVPGSVARAIERALAKDPNQRFATTSEFVTAMRIGSGVGTRARAIPSRQIAVVAAVVLAVVAAFGVWQWRAGAAVNTALHPDVIAVFPFRVGGEATAYLRESMLDLLHARLTGNPGPRTVEPRTLLAAWRRVVRNDSLDLSENASRRVAAGLGAGLMLFGSAIATPRELTLTGSVVRVSDGEVTANRSISGSPDSIAVLVNRLVAQLLILEAGEGSERVNGLAATSLDALRDYLAGRVAYRRGDFFRAMDLYASALARDSTFVEAAFGLVVTNPFIGTVLRVDGMTSIPLVWRMRDRLSARDKALLLGMAFVGPNYPAPSSYAEIIAQLERAATAAPDSPEHWLMLGGGLAQVGAVSSIENWPERARSALDRAISLDSSFAPALAMRLWVENEFPRDAAVQRRLEAMLERHVTSGFSDATMLWASAMQRGDTMAARRWRGEMSESPFNYVIKLVKLPLHSVQFGMPLDDARWANATLARDGPTEAVRATAWLGERAVAFGAGRMQADVSLWGSYTEGWTAANLVQQAIVEPAYLSLANAHTRRVNAVEWPPMRDCFGELLRVHSGDTSTTRGAVRRLRAFAARTPPPIPAPVWTPLDFRVCPLLLEAMLDGGSRLDSLDAVMRDGPRWFSATSPPHAPVAAANWIIAKRREAQGNIPAALAAIRRRERTYYPAYLWTLPAYLREEGRLAALAGDTAGAVAAYERYLVMRTDPDPPFRPQRDSVVAELARLVPRNSR